MDGFLNYQNLRYLKLAGLLSIVSILVYLFHQPQQEPNGGTWLGYGLGTFSALLILWLMYFGRRKRNYKSNMGTVKGWLSAHVYLGGALLIFATLHTGFQFGWNIHTLAYALMCLAIFSGFYGGWAYVSFPIKKRNNLEGKTQEEHFKSVEDIDRLITKACDGLDHHLVAVINSAKDRTEVGGGFFDQVRAVDKSKIYIDGKLQDNQDQQNGISYLATALSSQSDPQKIKQIRLLIDLFSQRKNVLYKIRKDIKINALLNFWLFFHIPISVALLAALIAHVVSVFIYW